MECLILLPNRQTTGLSHGMDKKLITGEYIDKVVGTKGDNITTDNLQLSFRKS